MGTVTMRLRWYSYPSLLVLCVTAFFVVLGFFTHGAFGLAVGGALLWVWMVLGMKVEVTPTDVSLNIWLRRRQSAPREEIKAMHWYGDSFRFVDGDQRVVLKVGGLGWAGGQLLELSEALGVGLYSHRTKHGLGSDVPEGLLMQRH